MIELIAIFFACRGIGRIARHRGRSPFPFQVLTVTLWILFEFLGAFVVTLVFVDPSLLTVYTGALAGAFLSAFLSFGLAGLPDSSVLAIASREFASFFRLPVGWVVTALFVFLTGGVFAFDTLEPGEPATMRYFFVTSGILLTLIAPAISMRLFSDELRSGTIEPLLTSPAPDLAIVLGKYLGACLFLVAMLLPTLTFPIVLMIVANPAPDVGPVIAGYAALVLLGMLYVAVGTLASSLTASQTLAFLGTLFVLIGFLLLTARVAPLLPDPYASWVAALSLTRRVEDFAKGVIDMSSVVFLLSLTVWFLVAAGASLESRRWR